MIDKNIIGMIKQSKCFYCVHRDGQFKISGSKMLVNCGLAKYPVCRTMKKHQCKDYDEIKSTDFLEYGHDFIEGVSF